MQEIIAKMIPIIALICLGYVLRIRGSIQEKTINEMKKFTIDFALSSVLLKTFATMELKKEYYILFFLIFIFLCLSFFISFGINKIKRINHPLLPFMTTGCSFYLFGIPLFSAVYGIENIDSFSIVGIGHEFFVWLVLFAKLRMDFGNERFSLKAILSLLNTPVMIGIFIGFIINISGAMTIVNNISFMKGLFNTVEYLATISTPLILIIIGYGLKINKKYTRLSMKILIIRLLLLLIVGYSFKYLIIDLLITTDTMFNNSYFTFLILPLPLSLPLIVGSYSTKENEELANNTVVMSTIVSIIVYGLMVIWKNII